MEKYCTHCTEFEEEPNCSELGTKEYWDESYAFELQNYKVSGDVGEIWFDEDSQIRVTDWMLKNNISFDARIVDLGCGNGMFLVELARLGYKKLSGIDYSQNAIELAHSISKDQSLNICYTSLDILNKEHITQLNKFDIVHDKGTYDAISLNPENSKEKRNNYIESVSEILDASGYFIITSCNWTEIELINMFDKIFIKYIAIETPTFKFAGKVGNLVTSIVFKHKFSEVIN